MSRPRVILHIGRNKAGSTTIQAACAQAAEALAADGIGYGLFGHLWQSNPALPGWPTFEALVAHATRHPERRWLVSNEFMSAWTPDYTAAAARALAGCDVRVVAYLRRYDRWLVSAYAESVRREGGTADIDGYAATMRPAVSALPNLREWARWFGWERMRVRGLDPADLHGGTLLADFAAAIGTTRPLPAMAPRNVAPGWPEIEIMRQLNTLGVTASAAGPLIALARRHAADVAPARYLSAADEAHLQAMFATDAAVLRGHGQRVSAPIAPAGERGSAPSVATLPPAILDRLVADAQLPAFAARHPDAAAAATRLAAAAP